MIGDTAAVKVALGKEVVVAVSVSLGGGRGVPVSGWTRLGRKGVAVTGSVCTVFGGRVPGASVAGKARLAQAKIRGKAAIITNKG
jgi:hypothetical protein